MQIPIKNETALSFKAKKVAVIGAGPSGLTTIKSLVEEGHQVICFEKSPDIGGVYRYAPDNIGTYESAQLTSSAFVTSFSDFPPPSKAPFHFKHTGYLQYLHDYATHFKLIPFIKLNHEVRKVEHLPQGTWSLIVFDQNSQKEEQYIFDAIAVCAGVHQNLSIPTIPNKEAFQGSILHSGHYKTADAFKDKNVVIVGGGESGSDITEEVSRVARRCVLSLRRGVLVVPRLIFGKPNDFYTTRLFYTVPAWFLRTRHKDLHWPSVCLSFFVIGTGVLLFNVLYFTLMGLSNLSPIVDRLLCIPIAILLVYFLINIFQYVFLYIGLKEFLIIRQLNLQSQAGHGEQFATKCQGIAKAIASKKCTLKTGIKKFTPNGVEFEDNTTYEADVIIFCTGYVTTYPFLGIKCLDSRNLYKNCFDPKIGDTLCFIGLARPAIGAIPPISEMQSRWFAKILSGDLHLPPADVIQTQINSDAQRHKQCFHVVSDRITGLVDYTSYMDELAGFIGCKPQWKDLCKEPLLLFTMYFKPFLACQYRLFGPNSKKELARKILNDIPLDIFQFMFYCFFACSALFCAILYRLGFQYFKPNLPL